MEVYQLVALVAGKRLSLGMISFASRIFAWNKKKAEGSKGILPRILFFSYVCDRFVLVRLCRYYEVCDS